MATEAAVPGKAANLAPIALAQVLALWFSGTAAGPGMAREAAVLGAVANAAILPPPPGYPGAILLRGATGARVEGPCSSRAGMAGCGA